MADVELTQDEADAPIIMEKVAASFLHCPLV